MIIDKEKLRAMAEASEGFDDVKLAPDVVLDLLGAIEKLENKCEAMGRYISVCRTRKRNYLRAVRWFLANTNIAPADMPEQILITVRNIVDAMIGQAKRAAEREKANG